MKILLGRVVTVSIAMILSLTLCTGWSSATLNAGIGNTQSVSSGMLSAAIVATNLSSNTKSIYSITSTNTTVGNFASLVNFGSIPLASETLTMSRTGANTASTLTLSYCSGSWNESTGLCNTGSVTLLTLTPGTNSATQTVSLFLAAGATWRLHLSSTVAGQSLSLSVTVTTSDVSTTTVNG